MKREEYYLPSSDGRSKIHMVLWKPDGPVRAVLQMNHGMTEHIMRYDSFAGEAAKSGIAVIGHDHLGHGTTAKQGDLGYFSPEKGHIYLIKDMNRVNCWMRKRYPDYPYFMMGHSMGSFLLRRYLTIYTGQKLTGAIIMGTGDPGLGILAAGKAVVKVIAALKGGRCRSALIHQLGIGNYNRQFAPVRTGSDWLSRDTLSVDQFCADPLCNFRFTAAAYRDFFNVMLTLKLGRHRKRMSADLPILLISGAEDPVGDFGRGVERVYKQYKRNGTKDIQIMLYPDDRHEILNELNKKEVYQDIINWIFAHCTDCLCF